jgi:hypothetical protein
VISQTRKPQFEAEQVFSNYPQSICSNTKQTITGNPSLRQPGPAKTVTSGDPARPQGADRRAPSFAGFKANNGLNQLKGTV